MHTDLNIVSIQRNFIFYFSCRKSLLPLMKGRKWEIIFFVLGVVQDIEGTIAGYVCNWSNYFLLSPTLHAQPVLGEPKLQQRKWSNWVHHCLVLVFKNYLVHKWKIQISILFPASRQREKSGILRWQYCQLTGDTRALYKGHIKAP